MKTEDIDTRLYELCGGMCLDNDAERAKVAEVVQTLISEAYGKRAPTDTASELHLLVRFHFPDDSKASADLVHTALWKGFPFLKYAEIEVEALPDRPFTTSEQCECEAAAAHGVEPDDGHPPPEPFSDPPKAESEDW